MKLDGYSDGYVKSTMMTREIDGKDVECVFADLKLGDKVTIHYPNGKTQTFNISVQQRIKT